MKHFRNKACKWGGLFTVLACLTPFATSAADNLKGTVEGVKTDTILVFSYDLVRNSLLKIDTVPLSEKHFSLEVPSDDLVGVRIMAKPEKPDAPLRMFSGMPFFVLPGDCLTLSGDVDRPVPSGTALYAGLSELEGLTALEKREIELGKAYLQAGSQNDKALQDSLSEAFVRLAKDKTAEKMKYIKSAPNTLVAGYLALNLPPKEGAEACKLLGSDVRNGVLKPLIDRLETSYLSALKKEEAQKYIQPGMPASDFKLKNLEGNEIGLSTFRGKYVLLDFWGTWCGWCIKGIPDMKAAYAKHKDHIEFVGICCRDTEEKWRAGVKKHDLPWVNLYNGFNDELTNKYAVPGYPTKILIDPDGKIVQVFVGESEDLYLKLDELFK